MTSQPHDLFIRGGTVVDGTGSAGVAADVRVRDGRIAEVGAGLAPDGEPELDAGGAVVAPGFLDLHTHLDPQVFWDPACDPQPQHGVTTALIGNCSLSLFPVTDEQRIPIADMFAFVEDVPADALDQPRAVDVARLRGLPRRRRRTRRRHQHRGAHGPFAAAARGDG